MQTIKMLEAVLDKKHALGILRVLNEEEMNFYDFRLKILIDMESLTEVLQYLNSLALILRVHTEGETGIISVYRITQRGRDIFEMGKDVKMSETERLSLIRKAMINTRNTNHYGYIGPGYLEGFLRAVENILAD